jgi:hypothetical protein
MIQRIQTLFLALAFLAATAVFFFPVAKVFAELYTYKLYLYSFKNMVPGEESVFSFMTTLPLLLLNIATAGLSLVSIFLYKKRLLQLKMVRMAMFSNVIVIGLIFFIYNRIAENNLGTGLEFDRLGVSLLLVVMLMLVLSNRFIVKDERLVRSIDRLR